MQVWKTVDRNWDNGSNEQKEIWRWPSGTTSKREGRAKGQSWRVERVQADINTSFFDFFGLISIPQPEQFKSEKFIDCRKESIDGRKMGMSSIEFLKKKNVI